MTHEFRIALTAVAAAVAWLLLFFLHTRWLVPLIIEAQFPGGFSLAVVVGLAGLGLLAWLGWIAGRRLIAAWRNRPDRNLH